MDYAKANKKWWDNVTPIHASSTLYDLNSFKKGKNSLNPTEVEELGNIKGKKLLHLMCHFGMDTLSLARLGATVTGVDISDQSIALAEKLSKETGIPGTFIASDIADLPNVLDSKFDIVFTSYGVLCWVSNMKKWAKLINQFLKKGGIFYITDLHPFTNMLSHDFKLSFDYFDKEPFIDDSSGTYTDWNADIKGKTYVWMHTMSELMNTLTQEGLHIEYVHEFPFTIYDQFPGFMKKNKKGQYILKDETLQIPLLFSLKATK